MCRYVETFHEYDACKLNETLPNGQPTPFASLLRVITKAATSGEEPQHHQIKEKNIFQCDQCVRDPKLKNLPLEKRVCENPVHISGKAARPVVENARWTLQVGTCPVCDAVEAVIKEKSNPTVIVVSQNNLQPNARHQHSGGQRRNTGTDKRNPIRHKSVNVTPPAQPVIERKRVKEREERKCSLM